MAAILGVFIVYSLVKEEYDELHDIALLSKANLLMQVFEARNVPVRGASFADTSNPLLFEFAFLKQGERTVFWVLGPGQEIIQSSPDADQGLLAARIKDGLVTAFDHRIAQVSTPDGQLSVVAAAPMGERNEAIREVVLGVSAGFILLGMFVIFAAYRAVRRSAKVIADLSAEIGTKDAHDLTPIDRKNTFSEIEPAIDTIDTLMKRLDATLAAERAFATNAAHELRTPVAICVAHVQRLRTKLSDPAAIGSAAEIEQALKRLTRLIERLLQMSRAQSGLGTAAAHSDIAPVVNLLLRELRARVPSDTDLLITPSNGIWRSNVDPDAIGIILNNLFDNALKHAFGSSPLEIDASCAGRIVISNDCEALTPDKLGEIQDRFVRSSPAAEGFGLGLSIVRTLCQQSGSSLTLNSPLPGQTRGFCAILTLPIDGS
ncbi:Periplasmic sensor signal transduction histidine kinase [Sulfitobacter guttiformis KCTC 32187]|nr:Periplasmic sensor signal transduction histidine kinase [Sulfitobacter guttiformis KCTC 32187]